MDIYKRKLELLLYSLLCKRKRRQFILLKWHTFRPVKATSIYKVFKDFITILLYAPIRISFSKDNFSVFLNQALPIHYSWLTADELELVKYIFIHRNQIFLKCDDKNLTLKNCKHTLTLDVNYRRELIRDFAHFLTNLNSKLSKGYCYRELLTVVLQQIIVDKHFETDRFIFELHHTLQNNGSVKDIVIRT